MDDVPLFGLFVVTAVLVTYSLEDRSHWFILALAAACLLGSIYGFLQGACPFGVIEGIWAAIAACLPMSEFQRATKQNELIADPRASAIQ